MFNIFIIFHARVVMKINFKTIGSASVVNKHIIYSWAPIFPEFRDARLQEFYWFDYCSDFPACTKQ